MNWIDPSGMTPPIWGPDPGGCPSGQNCVDPGPKEPPKDYPFPKQPGIEPPGQFPYYPPTYPWYKKPPDEPPSGRACGGERHRFSDSP